MSSLKTPLDWEDVPQAMDRWTAKTLGPAYDIKKACALLITVDPVHLYWNPVFAKAAVYVEDETSLLAKQACAAGRYCLADAVGAKRVKPLTLTLDKLASEAWVKVAQSIVPGNLYKFAMNGMSTPTPLTAGLVSGLVGAGLGYGAGCIGEQLLPYDHEPGKLRKNMAMAGAGMGVLPSLAWGYANWKQGLPVNSNDLIAKADTKTLDPADLATAVEKTKRASAELSEDYVAAVNRFTKSAFFTTGVSDNESAAAINVNALGQVLWESGASPQTTAATMGAMYAAQQMPDPNSRPGYVTSHQTGLLGTMMGAAGGGIKGYVAGALVGKTLDVLTGASPNVQNTLRNTGLALGIINSVVPRLYH